MPMTSRSLPAPWIWNSRPSRLPRARRLPSRALPLVFRNRPERGPLRMSAYAWPGTALVFSPAGALSVEEEEEEEDWLDVSVASVESDEDEDGDEDFSAPT